MMEIIAKLIESCAVVVVAGIFLTLVGQRFQTSAIRNGIVVGVIFGAIGIVSLLTAVEVGAGYRIDARDVAVALSVPVGGTVGVAITAAILSLSRFYLGGAGMLEGIFTLCLVAVGSAVFWTNAQKHREKRLFLKDILVLASITAASPVIASLIVSAFALEAPDFSVLKLSVPTNFAGTMLWGVVMARDAERRWVLAAFGKREEQLRSVANYVSDAPRGLDHLVHALATQLQALANNVPGILFQLYLDEKASPRFRYVSKGANRLLGISPEKLVERADIISTLVSPEALRKILESIRDSAADFTPWTNEAEFVLHDGRSLWLRIAAEPRYDSDDRLVWDGSMFDITQEKRNEQMKNEFISTVNHELRTPLTSIRGSLGLVAAGTAGELPDKAAALIKIALSNSERLVGLINDILDIEKIEAGRMTFDLERQPITPLIEQAIEACKGYLVDYGVTIAFADHEGGMEATVDGRRMHQVLVNLMSNAIKFSPKTGTVEIRLERKGDCIRIVVSDNGPGIDETFRDRVFKKFEQADASDSREKGGTGLGLSIVKALVEGMNGDVSFETEVGVGTSFYVDLPAIGSSDRQTIDAAPGRPRVLICEDEMDIAQIISLSLQEYGFASDIALNMEAAKAFLSETDYDAMTLDVRLAGESGITLLNDVRRLKSGANLPVIVISVIADEARQQINGSAIGIVDWLEKPIDLHRLKETVKRMREGNYQRKPSVLHVEDNEDVLDVVAASLGDDLAFSCARTVSEARTKLSNAYFDVIILDLDLPDEPGESLLDCVPPETAVIIFSAMDVDEKLARKVQAAMTKTRTSELSIASMVRGLVALNRNAINADQNAEGAHQ
ncbi:MAG: response regulator [Alphaproteobacteria bacterium]|nr:response regulator [Alphaproteobacteria bacterium]MCB9931713.1 response regulator [Alphaproteobacteria bacterium]